MQFDIDKLRLYAEDQDAKLQQAGLTRPQIDNDINTAGDPQQQLLQQRLQYGLSELTPEQRLILQRRQRLLSFKQYQQFIDALQENHFEETEHPIVSERLSMEKWAKDDAFSLLALKYTAGEPIKALEADLARLIACYEACFPLQAQYMQELKEQNDEEYAPYGTEVIGILDCRFEYLECIQVFSLCILLRRDDLRQRFARLFEQVNYPRCDAIFDLLRGKLTVKDFHVSGLFHKSFKLLADFMVEPEPAKAARLLQQYCRKWYSLYRGGPTHDMHLYDDGNYCGYWAFEAAALAFIRKLDDSKTEHLVYPAALSIYARPTALGS